MFNLRAVSFLITAMETSVIIRAKNEEKWIGVVLKKLLQQTYKNFDIIVVDSGSTDKTLEIVRMFPVHLFHIRPEEFSYPYALNFGCSQSNAERYFVFLSAHSLPLSDTWLENGLKNFSNPNVFGVYGDMQALSDGTLWEKLLFNRYVVGFNMFFSRKTFVRKIRTGVLGFTHAIIRRNFWDERKFDEQYGLGGEDGEWAGYWMNKGYIVVRDALFSVAHSHGLGLYAMIEQFRNWKSLSRPQPFRELAFRKRDHIEKYADIFHD